MKNRTGVRFWDSGAEEYSRFIFIHAYENQDISALISIARYMQK